MKIQVFRWFLGLCGPMWSLPPIARSAAGTWYNFMGPPFLKELLMGSAPMGSARKRAFVKNVTFRVQTAPFDKITMDFWRSQKHLYIPRAKKLSVRSTFF